MTRPTEASLVAAQAFAEYVAIAGRGALGKIRTMASGITHWIDTQPGLIWGVVALVLLLLWLTRKR